MNITERRQLEQIRRQLNKKLKTKNKELESILYAASHDLKSPLVNIQGFSHELSQSCELVRSALIGRKKDAKLEEVFDIALSKEIPESLNFILASTKKMDLLLSGLLDLSRLDTMAMTLEEIDMNTMIGNVVSSMEYQIKESGSDVKTQQLPPCCGDMSQISRIFSNLLSNALKSLDSSRAGKIKIYGTIEDDYRVYCVEDNGVGIAAKHQEKIFEIFYQLEPDGEKGEGIGLTIVRRIAERHNGRVWLESKIGKGSKFFVSLPRT